MFSDPTRTPRMLLTLVCLAAIALPACTMTEIVDNTRDFIVREGSNGDTLNEQLALIGALSDDEEVILAATIAGAAIELIARQATEEEKRKAKENGGKAAEDLTPEQRHQIIEENDGIVLTQVDEDTFMEYNIETKEVSANAYELEGTSGDAVTEGDLVEVDGKTRMVL